MENSYDVLYDILSSKSMEEVADAFYDCFGDSWAAEEYDYCLRVMGAEGMEEDEYNEWGEYDGLDSLEAVYEYMSLDEVMQHLSSDERDSMLEYYGYDDYNEEEEEEEDDGINDIYEDDICDIFEEVDGDFITLNIVFKENKEPENAWRNKSVYLYKSSLLCGYKPDEKDRENLKECMDALEEVHNKGIGEKGAEALVEWLTNAYEEESFYYDVFEVIEDMKWDFENSLDDEERASYNNDVNEYIEKEEGINPKIFEKEYFI